MHDEPGHLLAESYVVSPRLVDRPLGADEYLAQQVVLDGSRAADSTGTEPASVVAAASTPGAGVTQGKRQHVGGPPHSAVAPVKLAHVRVVDKDDRDLPSPDPLSASQ